MPRNLNAALLLLIAAALAGCGSPVAHGPQQEPAQSAGARSCPTAAEWQSALLTAPPTAPLTAPPTGQDSTPGNTPEAEALTQAVGEQGTGDYADVYGSQITDYPRGHVALCVTDLTKGQALAAAAKKAHPDIDLSRLDLYACRYSKQTLVSAAGRVAKLMPTLLGFPLYTIGPASDASGVQVTTTAQGAASQALHDRLAQAAGDGIPVTVVAGEAPHDA
ncbi:hypothetical protein P3T35_007365 [Kitasatospora sp. GP30]|uniref:hypothetical protein n=1 Tax=Kitasatospora sp. GP30 TaxID=3035084 RepID=UPI000C70A3C2|nr:hypothetical protein [Kitasatospora sp. GP30]MDH6145310.1 hypothetical protein [Kitasatospora sp. GP30]